MKQIIDLDGTIHNVVTVEEINKKIKELKSSTAYKVGLEDYTIKILEELLEE